MRFLAAVFVVSMLPAPAHAATFTAGANFGFMVSSFPGGSALAMGWPSGGFSGGLEPGLRLGIIAPAGREEVFLNTGATLVSSGGEDAYSIVNTLNYQHNFKPEGASPYLTAGIGFETIGFSGESSTQMVLGGALGVRHPVSQGHGAFRVEARLDHVSDSNSGTSFNSIGMQLGFDLWIR